MQHGILRKSAGSTYRYTACRKLCNYMLHVFICHQHNLQSVGFDERFCHVFKRFKIMISADVEILEKQITKRYKR